MPTDIPKRGSTMDSNIFTMQDFMYFTKAIT